MQMSFREILTLLHGMGLGGLLLLTFSGALIGLYRICTPDRSSPLTGWEQKLFRIYLIAMAVLAWGTVLSGAYIVYPWYRAHPPEGITDYSEYPQRLLLSNPTTEGWHSVGMEWKEHVAWFAPIIITMVAYIFIKYGSDLSKHRQVRKTAFAFAVAAFIAATIAGAFGALLNKNAPIRGGAVITIMEGTK
jgi:phosphoglycerol transferase MdoB-like AlkP superfamily enzyme